MQTNSMKMCSPNIICNCVNSYDGKSIRGELNHSYSKEPYQYDDIVEMLRTMEEIYDDLQFPMSSTESRSFFNKKQNFKRKGMAKVMQEDVILNKRGVRGTFIIQVQYRQNSSWQGEIIWVEKNKTQKFRSALELIKLMDGALNEGVSPKGENLEEDCLSG